MFRGLEKVDDDAFVVIRRIANGTIPSRINDLIKRMYLKDKRASYSLADAVLLLKLPSATTLRMLDGLASLDALERTGFARGLQPSWKLTEEITELIETSEVYK